MKRFRLLMLSGVVFVLNVVNMSGWGMAHQTERYMQYLFILMATYFAMQHLKQTTTIKRRAFVVGFCLCAVSVVSSTLQGRLTYATGYLFPFLITYVFANFKADDKSMRLIGIMMLVGSYFLMYFYLYSGALSGWNPNAIAMLAFFGFICFMATVMFGRDKRQKGMAIVAAVVFACLIAQTDSRSSFICVTLSILIMLFQDKSQRLFGAGKVRFIFIHFALLAMLLVVIITLTPVVQSLDLWSWRNFQKPFFNGRDTLWQLGLQWLARSPFIGNGCFLAYNWHNWTVSLLTTYGIAGYVLWTLFVQLLLSKGQTHINDPQVTGCIAAFLLILFQQTTELGLISATNTHLIPYMILGLMLGRLKYLNAKEYAELWTDPSV